MRASKRITNLQRDIDAILDFVKPYLPLANCHMVTYLCDEHWDAFVPADMRLEIGDTCVEAERIFWEAREKYDASKTVEPYSGYEVFTDFLVRAWSCCLKPNGDFCLTKEDFKSRIGEPPVLYKIEEFMNPKKAHEVHEMSSSVATLSHHSKASHLIDLGGGKGYLSASLAMLYNQKILSVDCSEQNTKSAKELQQKIEKCWPILLKKSKISKCDNTILNEKQSFSDTYKRTIRYITEHTDLRELIHEEFSDDEVLTPKICLTGLHTCGDLGAASLRLFKISTEVVSLMNVPCCYNLLTESTEDPQDLWFPIEDPALFRSDFGFPMSEYLKDANVMIGRNARMLTAQPIHRISYHKRFPVLSLFYRALLEVILRKDHNWKAAPAGKLRRVSEKCHNFDSYVKTALKKMKFAPLQTDYSSIAEQNEPELQRMTVFCLLRYSLGAVLESLILLDRLLFLAEGNTVGTSDAYLVRLFDPVISPRCYALVAIK